VTIAANTFDTMSSINSSQIVTDKYDGIPFPALIYFFNVFAQKWIKMTKQLHNAQFFSFLTESVVWLSPLKESPLDAKSLMTAMILFSTSFQY
jgi:hypothetical protein